VLSAFQIYPYESELFHILGTFYPGFTFFLIPPGYGRPRGVHKRPDRPVYSSRFRSGQQNFGSLRGFQAANNRSGKLIPTWMDMLRRPKSFK
jgi:hypothetical protein